MHVWDLIGFIKYVDNIDSSLVVPDMEKKTRKELCQFAMQIKSTHGKHFDDYMIFFLIILD